MLKFFIKFEDHNCKFRVSQTGRSNWHICPCETLMSWHAVHAKRHANHFSTGPCDRPKMLLFMPYKTPNGRNIHTVTVRTLPQGQGPNFIMAVRTLVVACALFFGTCFIMHGQTTETTHAFCKIVWQDFSFSFGFPDR